MLGSNGLNVLSKKASQRPCLGLHLLQSLVSEPCQTTPYSTDNVLQEGSNTLHIVFRGKQPYTIKLLGGGSLLCRCAVGMVLYNELLLDYIQGDCTSQTAIFI